MEVSIGTSVYGRKGMKIGEISHIVLDGQTQQVTHVVVSKGWLLPRDIVVSLDDVRSTSPEQVVLELDEHELEQQPDFIETHYVSPDPGDPLPSSYMRGSALYQPIIPYAGLGWYLPSTYMGTVMPPAPIETERNVPEGSLALVEGMDVWVGREKAGTLAGVRMHPRTERVTHIVISNGWLFPEEQLVPIKGIASVDAEGVHLTPSAIGQRATPRREDDVPATLMQEHRR